MYANREEAARALAEKLRPMIAEENTVIAGVPSGGAVVGAHVALALDLPFACAGVYKVPIATLPDTTLAVIDADGHVTFDPQSELTRYEVQKLGATTLARMHRDLEKCRSGAEEPQLEDATVIVTDEAVLSTLIVRGAATYLRHQGARHVMLATPIITASAMAAAERHFGGIIALNVVPDTDDIAHFYSEYRSPDETEMQSTVHEAYARQLRS